MIKIYGREFSLENLKEIAKKSKSISECIRYLGFDYDNSRLRKILVKELLDLQIDVSHFDSYAWHKTKIKYPKISKTCPICSKEFETQEGHPREKETCSHKCSNIYFSHIRHTYESNLKRASSLTKQPLIRICLFCKNSFETKRSRQFCCSNKCSISYRSQNPEYRKKLSDSIKKRIANGTHKGWATRSKLEPSYAEKYVISLLNELSIPYTRELKVGKWFLDFAQIENKLALEIDGKQHLLPERKESDNKKDKFLVENGWKILRIQWKKITKEFRNELILNITSFFNINSKTAS